MHHTENSTKADNLKKLAKQCVTGGVYLYKVEIWDRVCGSSYYKNGGCSHKTGAGPNPQRNGLSQPVIELIVIKLTLAGWNLSGRQSGQNHWPPAQLHNHDRHFRNRRSVKTAVHNAILTLKEGFDGAMTGSFLEIGIATMETTINSHDVPTKTGTFRRLRPAEIKDYLANIA
ncbi:hypothetical protein BJ742DRAFT_871512 [Cladochytrium replicatum]|nr:hypothetical protein BJ742DRAFT_871512 [Cladochytrium replicatum]